MAEEAEELLKICEGSSWVKGAHVCRGGCLTMRVSFSSSVDHFNEVHRYGEKFFSSSIPRKKSFSASGTCTEIVWLVIVKEIQYTELATAFETATPRKLNQKQKLLKRFWAKSPFTHGNIRGENGDQIRFRLGKFPAKHAQTLKPEKARERVRELLFPFYRKEIASS